MSAERSVNAPRYRRYWVHAMPLVVLAIVLVIAGGHGAEAFTVAHSDSGTRPSAPFVAFAAWLGVFIWGAVIGSFIVLLAYLVVLPARSRALFIIQIIFTSLAFVVSAIVLAATAFFFSFGG